MHTMTDPELCPASFIGEPDEFLRRVETHPAYNALSDNPICIECIRAKVEELSEQPLVNAE
ncbi:hypothetical protein KKC44_01405 [Patescibacteria group bacterium]|nr:hypothetical protein [Patescibacteria group bacterium]MBU2259239.1 hypothetical protein [Patescibacteria group bacterium]